jgi:plasmid replication initiation protein
MINDKKLSKNLPVVKNDKLIYARYNSTSTGMKIIYVAASKIKSEDMLLKEFTFSVRELCDLLEIKATGKYDKLKRSCKDLIQSYVYIETEKGWELYPWFSKIRYKEKEGQIVIQFNEHLSSYLLYVRDNIYTKISLHSVLSFKSQYAMRFYEICSQALKFKNIAEKVIAIDELRLMFGIDPNEYNLYGDFKRKVLIQAQKEINGISDIYFDFEEEKEARRVIMLRFVIKRNPKNQSKEDILEIYERQKEMPVKELALELQALLFEKYKCILDIEYILYFSRKAIQATIDGINENEFNLRDQNKSVVFFKKVLENKQAKYSE